MRHIWKILAVIGTLVLALAAIGAISPAPRVVVRTRTVVQTRTIVRTVVKTHTITRTIRVPVIKTVIRTRTVIKAVRIVATPATTPRVAPQATAVPTTDSSPEGATYQGVTVQQTQVWQDSNGVLPPDAGQQYEKVHIVLVNDSDLNYDYNALDFQLQDDGNVAYQATTSDTNIQGHELVSGTLAPGQTIAGDIAFAVPSADTSFILLWTPQDGTPALNVPLT